MSEQENKRIELVPDREKASEFAHKQLDDLQVPPPQPAEVIMTMTGVVPPDGGPVASMPTEAPDHGD